ncbi:GNAT family N-acetyltransferase [Lacicoccus alkaliphilus]|uniref:Protein N-acetyltransferase, RimJ/RimL family n=1 Tax=Lacicoccus alkaliphilus DSM 16010 TaxID=1123231 RepID=A0A1M7F2J1_9BACL|nr:GNAT family N-acetyltransferase [Salinicoccus alkaliphilus]SHL98231.1 Protein N-acetyltransferase, RimJ/RimL family [Salinicoccus alkaliphilus DSM 16010]
MKYIKTKRLILRDWKESDIPKFIELNRDRDVRRYFPDVATPEESKAFILNAQRDIDARGFGLFAVENRHTKEFIGFTGIQVWEEDGPLKLHFLPSIEIGWRFAKRYWNQGFATEAARGVVKFAERNTDIREIYAYTASINYPSINIMLKLGMKKVHTFEHPSIIDGHSLKKHVVYKMDIKKRHRFKL